MTRHIPVYRFVAGMMARTFFAYRTDFVFDFMSVLLQIFLLRAVWTAVYGGRESVAGLPLPDLIAYLTLATLQSSLMWPSLAWMIQDKVREGQVAIDLVRPTPFIGQMLAAQVGSMVGIVPFMVLSFPFAFLLGGIESPVSLAAGVLYVVSLVLGYVVVVESALLIGLLAFWTVEIYGILMIYRYASLFLAGGLMPLVFFPDWLRSVAQLLPFQTQIYLPIAIYLGQIAGADVARAFAVQLFWIVALAIVAQLLWSRARWRVIVHGG